MNAFLERLHNEILVGDGAIGTMLYAKGVGLDANFEHLNLVRPSLVAELHREYLAAGARVIETNTFAASRARLEAIGLERKVAEINRQGALLARQAVRDTLAGEAYVAGSVGPLPRPRGEERELSAAEQQEMFREQMTALVDGGVDLLILETFSDLGQLLEAVAVARESGLPVIASMAFPEGGRSAAGIDVASAGQQLTAAGVDLVGVNCGAGPLEVLTTIRRLAGVTTLPIAAYPNSGLPEHVGGRSIYRATPDYFAAMAAELVSAGATLVGGCCGTTPEHVRAIAERLRGLRPAPRTIVTIREPARQERTEQQHRRGFLAGWGVTPVVTVELDPPRGLDVERILAGSQALKEAGADAINLAENPLARARLGNIALAHLIQQEVGIEAIVHITCRDRNLLGLQSELMGASLLGIRSILAVTGDPARLGDQDQATSVYDLNSFGLIKLLADLNDGVNALGHSIDRGAGFTIGCAFNPNSRNLPAQVARLARKVANGARFVQTQPLYDPQRLLEVLELTTSLGIPLLPGIMPLVSERNCEYLHNEVPGITIPDGVRARMRGKEKETGIAEGIAIAREVIAAVRRKVGGFYIIAPFGKYELAGELTRFIKEGS